MITKEEAQRIVDKYRGSFSLLQREGTLEEKTAVLNGSPTKPTANNLS
ncbi:hypothetical protein [uncultured Streptococcus sp.]|nr:hypothetical protein [uncultured Streptococcus sp.]